MPRSGFLRLVLPYAVAPDGRLRPRESPGRVEPATGETRLYRKLAALADAPDDAIAAAASRYGYLGPLGPVAGRDPRLVAFELGQNLRSNLDAISELHRWIATGGGASIPARLSPAAHMLCAIAEADPEAMARVVDVLDHPDWPDVPPAPDLAEALDRAEQAFLAALTPRERDINAQAEQGDELVRVTPRPGSGRQLRLAARFIDLMVARAEEHDPAALQLPPDRLGQWLAGQAPYFEAAAFPTETVEGWREAARNLGGWDRLVRLVPDSSTSDRRRVEAALILRLQQVDAWPYRSGEQLGTYARALWSVWPDLTGRQPRRRCNWPGCETELPTHSRATRLRCDEHQRRFDRERMARRRQRQRAG